MSTYLTELASTKKYVGNVVVKLLGNYFSIRTPDSGLTVAREYNNLVSSLVLNPSRVDPRRVNTTIANYSFKLLDKNGVISKLVKENGSALMGQQVEIWIGRSNASVDFADYYKLPITRIKSISRQDAGYSFSTVEESDRMNRAVYNATTRLSGSVFSGTTTITCKDSIADFPASGFCKIGTEFFGYTSKNDSTFQFLGVTRGEYTTTPESYEDGENIYIAEQITDNPINIILKLLISGGGGGVYDTLNDGLGISNTLVDIAGIEELRDTVFLGDLFTLAFYNIENALKFIETELLAPCNLRFTYSRDSLLTIALLDKAKFVEYTDVINHDTLTSFPNWTVADNNIVNNLQIDWHYDEDTGKYLQRSTYTNATSIANFGESNALKLQFKGVRSDLEGSAFIDSFANALLDRLANPNPEITVKTHIDKSLLNIADKTVLETTLLPNSNGQLNFADELEVIERAINYQTGDVSLKLAFTTFTGIRSCYIAPSDTIGTVNAQNSVTLGAGRGDMWQVGFKVRLWDNVANGYTSDTVNTISGITGDTITFENNFSTTLTTSHRLKFPDYDDATDAQKRYCSTGDNLLDFSDDGKRYKILT